jgi:hypothetical protein
MAAETRSWFHGYVAWYVRAVLWVVQSAVAAAAAVLVFGTEGTLGLAGTALAGLLASLFLFRQFHNHVHQELGE